MVEWGKWWNEKMQECETRQHYRILSIHHSTIFAISYSHILTLHSSLLQLRPALDRGLEFRLRGGEPLAGVDLGGRRIIKKCGDLLLQGVDAVGEPVELALLVVAQLTLRRGEGER